MKHGSRLLVVVSFLLLVAFIMPVPSANAVYPEKKIIWVVPFAAGGGTDRWARLMGSVAEKYFGQVWIIANVPGAQGINGWNRMLSKPADGYTILQGSGTLNLALALNPNPRVSSKEIKILAQLAAFPGVLVVKPGQPWSDWKGFKAYAEKNPGKLVVGGSMGTLITIAHVLNQTNVKVKFVPYPGAGAAVSDFLGGHIHCAVVTPVTAQGLFPERGALVFSTGDKQVPDPLFKNVPSANDLGAEGLQIMRWVGVHPDTPDAIADAISTKLGALMRDKKVVETLKKSGEPPEFLPRAAAEKAYFKMVTIMEKSSKLLK